MNYQSKDSRSHTSAQSLQEDLHNLELWEKEWSMEFNPDKCEVLRIHRKKKPVIFPYTLYDTTLRTTENAKYLGVTISSLRAIRLWNELPTEIKDAPTVPAFASGLNKFYAF